MTSNTPPKAAAPRFQAVKLVGRGGMGFVQLAFDNQLNDQVAIKYVERGFSSSKYKYILREVLHHQQLSLCSHPHIVSFHEIFLTPKFLAIVMEYVEGPNLQTYVDRHGGKLEEDTARFVFQQLMIAVDFIHKKGKVNRDIKLANVLVSEKGKLPLVKLCDFGFSKDKYDDSAPKTQIGTALFAAPEIFLNVRGGVYDAEAVDMWSCGVVLFMLLFGSHPFLGANAMRLPKADQMTLLVENTVKGDLQLPPGAMGSSIGELLRHMLIIDPAKRYKMSQVLEHPWFMYKLPPGALHLNNAYLESFSYAAARQPPSMIRQIVQTAAQALGPDGKPEGPSLSLTNDTVDSDGMLKDAFDCNSGSLSSADATTRRTPEQQQQQQEQYAKYLLQTQQNGVLQAGSTSVGQQPPPIAANNYESHSSVSQSSTSEINPNGTSIELDPARSSASMMSQGVKNSKAMSQQQQEPQPLHVEPPRTNSLPAFDYQANSFTAISPKEHYNGSHQVKPHTPFSLIRQQPPTQTTPVQPDPAAAPDSDLANTGKGGTEIKKQAKPHTPFSLIRQLPLTQTTPMQVSAKRKYKNQAKPRMPFSLIRQQPPTQTTPVQPGDGMNLSGHTLLNSNFLNMMEFDQIMPEE
eukprot:gene8856-3740_t